MRIVDVYGDVACPFTYVGLRRFAETIERQGADVVMRVHAWPLEWVNGEPLDPGHVAAEIDALRSAIAPTLFAGFDQARFPRTSIPAFGLAAAAYARDDSVGFAVSREVRAALFEGGLDISRDDVLRDIGDRHEIEPMDADRAAASARADWDEGKRLGVVGSPHYFVGEHDWFCPGLRIEKKSGRFDIGVDDAASEAFLAEVLR